MSNGEYQDEEMYNGFNLSYSLLRNPLYTWLIYLLFYDVCSKLQHTDIQTIADTQGLIHGAVLKTQIMKGNNVRIINTITRLFGV